VRAWFDEDLRPTSEEVIKVNLEVRHYWHLWKSLFLENGILYRRFEKRNNTGEFKQLVVPKSLK
jgi:hypothetical protein